MVTAVEKHAAGACILGTIISELGHRQEPSSVILLGVDKGLKGCFPCAILLLGLTVSLRMVAVESLYAKNIAEQ